MVVVSATVLAGGLAAGHGARVLFTDLDLVVAPGDVVGLVGVNGAGKSTLLQTLAGVLPAEAGEVVLSPPSATVGYLRRGAGTLALPGGGRPRRAGRGGGRLRGPRRRARRADRRALRRSGRPGGAG